MRRIYTCKYEAHKCINDVWSCTIQIRTQRRLSVFQPTAILLLLSVQAVLLYMSMYVPGPVPGDLASDTRSDTTTSEALISVKISMRLQLHSFLACSALLILAHGRICTVRMYHDDGHSHHHSTPVGSTPGFNSGFFN